MLSVTIAVTSLVSCAKEATKETVIPAGENIQVAVGGSIGDFESADDATKANAESVIRVTWAADDKVYVYDGSTKLGTLTVTPDEDNASHALLSGTITASGASPAPSKLALVYVKGAEDAPAINGGKISVDISSQSGTASADVPFVLYATIDYDKEKLTKEKEFVPFNFATSVMTVNCTNLPTGAENAKIDITKAEIDGVSTACELTIEGTGVTAVAGANAGTITRGAGFEQADSRGSFKVALAADPVAPAARNILVFQNGKVSGAPFTAATLKANKSYNTVYQLGEYLASPAGGYEPAVRVTGISLKNDKATVTNMKSRTLVATVAPENATNKQVTWSSSDTKIATVDENGKVTGVAEGCVNITATTVDGNISAVCLVTVIFARELPGVFTVGDVTTSWKKVRFSTGNLYYDGRYLSFEDEQYYFHTYNGNGKCDASGYNPNSGTTDGDWGLFGWSTQGIPYGMSTSTDNRDYSGDFIEWTPLAIGTWRTLSGGHEGEWNYLFDHHVHVWGTCNNVPGCFIAPDGFDGDAAALSAAVSDWESAEADGIVFLPAAGYRDGSSVSEVGVNGYYWSSSALEDNAPYYVNFDCNDVKSKESPDRYYGRSVRLVTEIK